MRKYIFLLLLKSVLITGVCQAADIGNDINPPINTVIIPAAGAGTRWNPWTLSMPKEMLPVGTQPGIAYVVHEAIASGCPQIIIIANAQKNTIVDYFEKVLLPASFTYISQPKPLGLGHAVLMARPVVHEKFFGIILPDELFFGKKPGLQQLIEIARREKASVIAVNEVSMSEVSSYGIVAIKKQLGENLFEISALVEKPKTEHAPSNLAISGRYVLSSKIFDSLAVTSPGAKGEIQLTDAIADMLRKGERVLAYKLSGTRYDIGFPLGWTKTVIGLALKNPAYHDELTKFIAQNLG